MLFRHHQYRPHHHHHHHPSIHQYLILFLCFFLSRVQAAAGRMWHLLAAIMAPLIVAAAPGGRVLAAQATVFIRLGVVVHLVITGPRAAFPMVSSVKITT